VEHHPFHLFHGIDPYLQYLTIDEEQMHSYASQAQNQNSGSIGGGRCTQTKQ
jgi:hypothetical protein